mgnify:FL=1
MLVRVRSESPVSASHEVKRKMMTPRLDKLRIAESIPLTPLSHNIPRRARTVHAKDDETIVEIASRLEFDPKKLMKLNRSRYPSLTMNAKLMEGTVLVLDAEARELEEQIVVENPWTTGMFGPYVSHPQRDLNEVYSDLVVESRNAYVVFELEARHLHKSDRSPNS